MTTIHTETARAARHYIAEIEDAVRLGMLPPDVAAPIREQLHRAEATMNPAELADAVARLRRFL